MDFSEFPFDSHVCYFKVRGEQSFDCHYCTYHSQTHLDLPDDEARLFQPGLDDVIGGDGGKEKEEERNRREDSVSSPEFTFHFMHLPEEHTSEMARLVLLQRILLSESQKFLERAEKNFTTKERRRQTDPLGTAPSLASSSASAAAPAPTSASTTSPPA